MIRGVVAIGIVTGAAFNASAAPVVEVVGIIAALPNLTLAACSGALGVAGFALVGRNRAS